MFIGTWDFNIHIWLYDRVQYGFGSNIMIFHNFLGPRGLNLWPSMRFGYPCWCDHDTSAWRPVSKKGSHTCSGLYDFMIFYDILWYFMMMLYFIMIFHYDIHYDISWYLLFINASVWCLRCLLRGPGDGSGRSGLFVVSSARSRASLSGWHLLPAHRWKGKGSGNL